jgi:hypothetical protein
MVERYFLAFLLAMIAVRLFTKLVLAYAGNDQRNQNVVSASGKSNKKGKK